MTTGAAYIAARSDARDQIDWNPEWSPARVRRPRLCGAEGIGFNRNDDTPEENDVFTDEIIEKINATGEAFFSGTTWRGRRAMRVSVVNWRTSERDIERAVAAACAALTQSHANPSLHIEGWRARVGGTGSA